jgi:hypothetical protein
LELGFEGWDQATSIVNDTQLSRKVQRIPNQRTIAIFLFVFMRLRKDLKKSESDLKKRKANVLALAA